MDPESFEQGAGFVNRGGSSQELLSRGYSNWSDAYRGAQLQEGLNQFKAQSEKSAKYWSNFWDDLNKTGATAPPSRAGKGKKSGGGLGSLVVVGLILYWAAQYGATGQSDPHQTAPQRVVTQSVPTDPAMVAAASRAFSKLPDASSLQSNAPPYLVVVNGKVLDLLHGAGVPRAATNLNVRSCPSASCPVIGVFQVGGWIGIVAGAQGDWVEVEGFDRSNETRTGYANSRYMIVPQSE